MGAPIRCHPEVAAAAEGSPNKTPSQRKWKSTLPLNCAANFCFRGDRSVSVRSLTVCAVRDDKRHRATTREQFVIQIEPGLHQPRNRLLLRPANARWRRDDLLTWSGA